MKFKHLTLKNGFFLVGGISFAFKNGIYETEDKEIIKVLKKQKTWAVVKDGTGKEVE